MYKLSLPKEKTGLRRFMPRGFALAAACLAAILLIVSEGTGRSDFLFGLDDGNNEMVNAVGSQVSGGSTGHPGGSAQAPQAAPDSGGGQEMTEDTSIADGEIGFTRGSPAPFVEEDETGREPASAPTSAGGGGMDLADHLSPETEQEWSAIEDPFLAPEPDVLPAPVPGALPVEYHWAGLFLADPSEYALALIAAQPPDAEPEGERVERGGAEARVTEYDEPFPVEAAHRAAGGVLFEGTGEKYLIVFIQET
jgi:hypothetical protein